MKAAASAIFERTGLSRLPLYQEPDSEPESRFRGIDELEPDPRKPTKEELARADYRPSIGPAHKLSASEEREQRVDEVLEGRREDVAKARGDLARRIPGALTAGELAIKAGQVGRAIENLPLLGLPTTGLRKGYDAVFNRDGRPTPEEMIDALPRSKTQTVTEFLGYGAEIFLTGKVAGDVGKLLTVAERSSLATRGVFPSARAKRTGEVLKLFEPTRRVTTGQALVTEALVGLPSDVVGAIRDEDPFRVPVGVILGSTLGTALRPKIRGVEPYRIVTNSYEASARGKAVGGFRTPQRVTRAGTEARGAEAVTVARHEPAPPVRRSPRPRSGDLPAPRDVDEQRAVIREIETRKASGEGPAIPLETDASLIAGYRRLIAEGGDAARIAAVEEDLANRGLGPLAENIRAGTEPAVIPDRAAVREPVEGETITDLFGEKGVAGGPEQGKLFEFEPDKSLSGSERRAREVVSALEGKVKRGQASEAELAQYQDAVTLLNRDELIAEAEIRTRATGDEHHDPLVGDLFEENAPVPARRLPDGSIEDGHADFLDVDAINGQRRGDDFVADHELAGASFDEVIAARKRDLKAREQASPTRAKLQMLPDGELEAKWRQYKRWEAKEKNATAGKEGERVIEVGGKGSGGDKVVAGEKKGMNARGRQTMARRSVAEAEAEMRARGIDVPEEKTIWSGLSQSDVQAGNKALVGRGGKALTNAPTEELTRLQSEAYDILLKDPLDFTMSERWALIENELELRGLQADPADGIMRLRPGQESPPRSPLQPGHNPLNSELEFLRHRRDIVDGSAAEVPSRENMINALAQVIGMKPGVGKSNVLRKALGFFRVVTEDIRLRNASDVEVYTHEVGHFLHKLWFGGVEVVPRRPPPKGQILPRRKQVRLVDAPLEQFKDELEPLAVGVSDGSLAEGWAEFWRLFVTNPEPLLSLAPRTFTYAMKRLDGEHDLANVLIAIRNDWERWATGSKEARIDAHLAYTPKPKQYNAGDIVQSMREAVLDELQPWQRLQDTLLGGNPVDIKDAAADLARLLRGSSGTAEHMIEHGTLDAATLNVRGRGLEDILSDLFHDAPNNRTFKSKAVRQEKVRAFNRYWTSRRDLEQKLKGLKTGFQTVDSVNLLREQHPEIPEKLWQDILTLNDRNPSPVLLKRYREALRSTDDGGGVHRQVFDNIQTYRIELLEYMRDLGAISDRELKQMLADNTEYAPLYREMGQEGSRAAGGKRQGELGKPIKRFKGSERQVINPIESLIADTYRFTQAAHSQEVSNALIRLSRMEGAGAVLSQVTPPNVGTKVGKEEMIKWMLKQLDDQVADPDLLEELFEDLGQALPEYMMTWRPGDFFGKDNIVSFINPDTRKREWFEVLDRELYESLMGLDRQELHWFTRLASVPARTLRAGATLAIEFAARNPIRDNLAAAVQSEYGFKPGVDLARGLFEMYGGPGGKGTDLYWKWKAAGGERAALVDMDREGMRKAVDLFTHTGGVRNVVKDPMQLLAVLDRMLGPLRAFSSASEDATRLGEFRNAVKILEKQGFKGRELYQRAALAAREVSVDFARHGTKTQSIRHMAAFWNARLQGYDRLYRAFQKNPQRATTKALTWITLPTVANFLANKDDPEYWQLPRWQRDFFWMVKVGDTWLRVPKPFELGLVFGTMVERIMEWQHLEDPETLNSLLGVPMPKFNPEGFATGAAPLIDVRDVAETAAKNPLAVDFASAFMPIPTAVQPLLENYFNYSIFLQRPIVSGTLEGRSPFLQSTARTSDVAKGFGRMFNLSPAKVDNLLYAYTGGLGRMAGELVTGARDVASRIPGSPVSAPEIPRDRLKDFPGLREVHSAFTARNPGLTSAAMENFYAKFERAAEANQNLKFMEDTGDYEAARVFRRQNRDLLESWDRLSDANERIKPLRARLREVQSERPPTAAGRKARDERAEEIGRRMTNEALRGLNSDLPWLPVR